MSRQRCSPILEIGSMAVAWVVGVGLMFFGCAALANARSPDELPKVSGVELQPLRAQARRIVDALEMLGQPLSEDAKQSLEKAYDDVDQARAVQSIQTVLDPLCLAAVEINPESRVSVRQGPAEPLLVKQGWRVFLIKVHNEAGVTAALNVKSPNAAPIFRQSSNSPDPKMTITDRELADRWLELASSGDRPLNPKLSGLALEYRVIQLLSRDSGKREAKLAFDVGQGTQDLGFRSELDLLFTCLPAVKVTFEVLDEAGKPTTASFLIRDRVGRVYPSRAKRLAPDFFFHPQIYRASGETVDLPSGRYTVESTRGPEYLVDSQTVDVPDARSFTIQVKLKRWIHLAKLGWFSGDHHVHAAGCMHYENPTQGVKPEDMMRHLRGEDLDVGCVLSWGPCWYAQKVFFEGAVHKLSTASNLMRYDVEVSGFPSSHAGHLCLLNLKEDDFPGANRIEDWPSWDLPVLKWGKSQGGVVGFSHSGWGLRIVDERIPSDEVPPFDGIGANEFIVDVAHDAVDFISTVDTPAPWELNIWYHTLNCGFRTRISGETDFPCIYGEKVGLGRVYVKLENGQLDFGRWIDGVREGRSYVSDGKSHLIDFEVGGVKVGEQGSELRLDHPRAIEIKVRAAARLEEKLTPELEAIRSRPLAEKPYWDLERSRIASTRRVPLELLVNGKSVETREIDADGSVQEISFTTKIDRSSWVALRIYPSSHTNPVFVVVDGKPIRASRKSARWCLSSVDRCWDQKARAIRRTECASAKEAYDQARETYQRILEETNQD